MSIDDDTIKAVIKRFPPSKWIFAYGSSVFPQVTSKDTASLPINPPKNNKLLDMIVVVDNPSEWHHRNMQINPDDYSLMAKMYPHLSHRIGEAWAGMYFNADLPLIPHTNSKTSKASPHAGMNAGESGRRIKYGVIGVHSFILDCTEWKWMYLAGRLHKPVYSLHPVTGINEYPPGLAPSIHANQRNALIYSLLQLHRSYSSRLLSLQLVDILRGVVGLSYLNDIRFTFKTEDPLKVEKIVCGSRGWLEEMYLPLLSEIGVVQSGKSGSGLFISNADTLLMHLFKTPFGSTQQQGMTFDKQVRELGKRQWWASVGEAIKGVWSNGPWTSIQYVKAKINKALGKH